MMLRPALCMIAAGLTMHDGGAAFAQSFPYRPLRMITAEPGGSNDLVARVVAQGLNESLGQPVVVDYRGGASGIIAAQLVANATPDGYTLLSYGNTIWISPLLQQKPAYDVVNDFAPVSLTVTAPNLLVVNPQLPVHSVRELIELAKAHPGEFSYASGITGSSTHLSAELFKSMAGIDMVRIPYKGSGPALNDLVAGHVRIMFPIVASGVPYVKAGRLRALAVTSLQPSELLPDLPTIAASGLPGYESTAMSGIWAPARTPRAVVNLLSTHIARALNRAETRQRLLSVGTVAVGSSPEAFAAQIRAEIARMGRVIKAAGIRAD